jgi:hypothetical protein
VQPARRPGHIAAQVGCRVDRLDVGKQIRERALAACLVRHQRGQRAKSGLASTDTTWSRSWSAIRLTTTKALIVLPKPLGLITPAVFARLTEGSTASSVGLGRASRRDP